MSESSSSDDEIPVFTRISRDNSARIIEDKRQKLREEQALALSAAHTEQPQEASENDVDDTDGLDPEMELKDWQQRERRRVEREIAGIEAAEAEIQAKLENRAKRLKREEKGGGVET